MKYIIIGLGNFGSSLAVKLTELGHEVIGVDSIISKAEALKGKITHTICVDCTDIQAIKTLPLMDADVIIVAIGEDRGSSVMITALLKQMNVKKLIVRAINPLHQTIIEAIGVHEIVYPEQESADRMVKRLEMDNIIDSLDITDDYSIIEAVVPEKYVGRTLKDVDLRGKYNLNVITIKRSVETRNLIGIAQKKSIVIGVVKPDEVFEKNDIIVLFGNVSDLKHMLYPKE